MDGPDRPAMGTSRSHPAGRSGTGRWARPSMERTSKGVERSVMDSAHWGAVARFAPTVWIVPNGAPPLPELGALWSDRRHTLVAGQAPPGGRRIGSQRMLCGRDVCSGQKRGRLVGKTKRGKGTKIMGIADRHGLPLAVRTESASPAEVTLVEKTLEERIVADVPERLIGDKAYDSDRLDEQLWCAKFL